jgi:hypothetical protein
VDAQELYGTANQLNSFIRYIGMVRISRLS